MWLFGETSIGLNVVVTKRRRSTKCNFWRWERRWGWSQTVWLDDGIKNCLNLPQIAQKVGTHFLNQSDIIRNSPKSYQNIWSTFASQFVVKNLQKSPNLVTLVSTELEENVFIIKRKMEDDELPKTVWTTKDAR